MEQTINVGDASKAELLSQIEQLKAQTEALKAKAKTTITFKVSQKGAVSVYGMGRFPVTLYLEQWTTLFSVSESLKSFIEKHRSELTTKG